MKEKREKEKKTSGCKIDFSARGEGGGDGNNMIGSHNIYACLEFRLVELSSHHVGLGLPNAGRVTRIGIISPAN